MKKNDSSVGKRKSSFDSRRASERVDRRTSWICLERNGRARAQKKGKKEGRRRSHGEEHIWRSTDNRAHRLINRSPGNSCRAVTRAVAFIGGRGSERSEDRRGQSSREDEELVCLMACSGQKSQERRNKSEGRINERNKVAASTNRQFQTQRNEKQKELGKKVAGKSISRRIIVEQHL